MELQVYINGEYVDRSKATVSVFDHGFLYGDGVFEGIRIYNGRAFALREHVQRLFESARAIHLEIPMTREEVTEAIQECVAKNVAIDPGVNYIRPIVSRGVGTLGLNPFLCEGPSLFIVVDKLQMYPAEMYEAGIEIITAATIRNHPAALNPRIKSLNYLNNILAKIEGHQAGCMETLMLNHEGFVAECSADNFFIVRNGRLHTPPTASGALKGVTRDLIIRLAREDGIDIQQNCMTRHDAYIADEAFLTGTGAEVMPVKTIDGRPIGTGKPGPVTVKLIGKFRQYVDEQTSRD